MRQRMEGAMSEMGGMASKLTDALTERDCLKKEVLCCKLLLCIIRQ